jgi:hypothetical protein
MVDDQLVAAAKALLGHCAKLNAYLRTTLLNPANMPAAFKELYDGVVAADDDCKAAATALAEVGGAYTASREAVFTAWKKFNDPVKLVTPAGTAGA